jgi:pentatricopeptide repeat protein
MSRVSKIWPVFLVFISTLALIACSNIFNPSGEGDGGTAASDFLDAEKAFRNGDYEEAIRLYRRMVERDSSLSEGYYGIANANLWMNMISSQVVRDSSQDTLHMWSKLIEIAQTAQESPDSLTNILQEKAEFKNALWQGLKQVSNNLATLTHRDTLTYYWELDQAYGDEEIRKAQHLKQSTKDNYEKLRALHRTPDSLWFDLDSLGKPDPSKPFPLSDRKITLTAYSPVLAASKTISTILKVFDINNDDCITDNNFSRKPSKATYIGLAFVKKAGCLHPEDTLKGDDLKLSISLDGGTGSLNAQDIYDEIVGQIVDSTAWVAAQDKCANEGICEPPPLPSEMADLNQKLDDLVTDSDSLLGMIESITSGVGGQLPGAPDLDSLKDASGTTNEDIKDQLDSAVNKYAAYMGFYKFGDQKDNDGDGCVDEEWIDGFDNDVDEISNEDLGFALIGGKDLIDNDMNGTVDLGIPFSPNYPDSSEWPDYVLENQRDTTITVGGKDTTFTIADTTGAKLKWITAKSDFFNSPDKDLKLLVAKDASLTKIWPNYPADTISQPVSQEEAVQWRIDNIGGCWPNYKGSPDKQTKWKANTTALLQAELKN